MFRSWHPDAQPDSGWPGFNNVHAGNRVNINTFNTFPRGGPNHLPFPNIGGPRLFDFAQLFNLAGINGFPPQHPNLRDDGRLRNRVTVLLPDGSRVMVDRDVMHEHLPRTRHAMPGGGGLAASGLGGAYFAVPEFLRGYRHGIDWLNEQSFNQAFSRATTFVFRHIEALCRNQPSAFGADLGGAGTFDMFARPRFILANSRDRAGAANEIFWHVFLLCCVLDQDRALGCSEMLARSIGEFLVEFMPRAEMFLPPGAAQLLFIGYARIFRESQVEMEVLRELWELMDIADQMYLRGLIGPQLPGNGMANNAHRIWAALRQLGLV